MDEAKARYFGVVRSCCEADEQSPSERDSATKISPEVKVGGGSGRSCCYDGPSAGHVRQCEPIGPASNAFGIGAMIGPRSLAPSALHSALAGWSSPHEPPAGALFVLKLEAGGPAKLSGQVREGDELLAVDRQKVANLPSQAVAELLHGAQESLVKLRLRRKDVTFDVCLQRDAPRQEPPVRKTRTLNPARETEGATDVLEKLYRGFAKVNNARTVPKPEKMSPEETKAFHAAQQDKAKRQESISKRCLDATKRRRAEIGVLKVKPLTRTRPRCHKLSLLHVAGSYNEHTKLRVAVTLLVTAQRELQALEKQDAPFGQILEYKNWIQRLEIEDDLGPMQIANLDQLELEAEELELQERAEYLKMTLSVLEAEERAAGHAACSLDKERELLTGVPPGHGSTREGVAGAGAGCDEQGVEMVEMRGEHHNGRRDGQRGAQIASKGTQRDIDIIKAKLQRVDEQLDRLHGLQSSHAGGPPAQQDASAEKCREQEQAATVSGCQVQGSKQRDVVEGEGSTHGERGAASLIAGLAAELGSKWDARGAEPREGARAAAEGTLEEAPEPCMLAQGTIDTAHRLWKFGLH